MFTAARLSRAAGLRWPVEGDFEFAKDHLGLDQCQARLHTAITRHTVLVMAALAVCAVTAAQLRERTDTQPPPPRTPDEPPPADPGLIPLTVPELKRLLAAALHASIQLAMPPTGKPGDAVTKPDHAGTTNAPVSTVHTPWSKNQWRLPY